MEKLENRVPLKRSKLKGTFKIILIILLLSVVVFFAVGFFTKERVNVVLMGFVV